MCSLLSESRIKWLRDHVLSRGWNAAQFASKADLDYISHPRTGAIYSSRFQVLGDDLSGEVLFRRVVELESKFIVSEHTPTLFAESFKAKDLVEEPKKPVEGGMEIRKVKAPAPQGRKTKKQKVSRVVAKTAQADSEIVRVDPRGDKETRGPLQLDSPPSPCKSTSVPLAVSIPGANADTHLSSSPPSLKPRLCLSFRRDDGSYVSEGDPIAFEKEACLAVAQSLALNTVDHDKLSHLSLRDLVAQLALCLQSASLMTQHIVMRTDAIEERLWSIMHKAREEALTTTNNLAKALTALEQESKEAEAKDKEISELKAKLVNETAVRSKEFELNQNEILKSSCKYFRLGWVQGQQNDEDKIFVGPESFDAEVGLDASDYDWILGMKPEDRPTDEEADDDVA